MTDAPDYGSYSLADLEDALRHIDKDRYPDRVKLIEAEIAQRLHDLENPPPAAKKESKPKIRLKRNWISGLLVLVIGFSLAGFAGKMQESNALKDTTVFEDALFFARENAEVQGAIGDSITPGMFISGAMSQEEDWSKGWPPRMKEAGNLSIPISGPNGSGILNVSGAKSDEVWEFSKLEVVVEGAEKPIDLIDRTQVVQAKKKPGKKRGGWGGKKWGGKSGEKLSEVDQLKQSSAYKDALFYAKNSASVVAALGQPIENSEPTDVSYSSERIFGQGPPKTKGSTSFKTTLTGQQGQATLTVTGKQDGPVWEFSKLEVQLDTTTIDLITDTEMIEAPLATEDAKS